MLNREKNIKALLAAKSEDMIDVWVVPGFVEIRNHTEGYSTSFASSVSDEEIVDRLEL